MSVCVCVGVGVGESNFSMLPFLLLVRYSPRAPEYTIPTT